MTFNDNPFVVTESVNDPNIDDVIVGREEWTEVQTMSAKRDNNYSEILRLRSQEFYSNVLSINANQRQPKTTSETTPNHNWLQMSPNFEPILRSNSSLSLNTNHNNFSFNSIDFKDFKELRECRFGSESTATSITTAAAFTAPRQPKTTSSSSSRVNKSRTIGSVQSLSVSNENVSKSHVKSNQKKTKSLFFKTTTKDKTTNSETTVVGSEDPLEAELDRRRRLRQLFIHYDIQSALSLDELWADDSPTTTTTADDETSLSDVSENEFNSNSLLSFSQNYRNEVAKESVFCVQLNRENNDNTTDKRRQLLSQRPPLHTPALARQLSCLSSFDMSSDVCQASLLSSTTSCPFAKGYDVEERALETDFGSNYYRKYFYGFSHQNWFLVSGRTAMALSLRKDSKDLKKLRVILRTNHSLKTLKGFLDLNHVSGMSARALFDLLVPRALGEGACKLGVDSKSDELLLKFDELLENNSFKVGVLYARDSQCTEEDFYNNREVDDPDLDHFLSLIGTRVRLKGYKGFRGGLDVTTDTTGLHAFATRFDDNELVYHVMHELPFSHNNRQQLLRKRHIGNDIITIVFQSKHFRGRPFDPHTIRSHFQHVFIVVRPLRDGYCVAVARQRDVPPFGPPLKPFYRKEELRDFLLTKVINAENACHKCAKFKQMALRTRFEYLNDLYLNHTTTTTALSFMSSNVSSLQTSSSTQQLIQFSQNFNKYFQHIFQKADKRSKEAAAAAEGGSSRGTPLEGAKSETKNIFLENELLFGAKLYESLDDRRQPSTTGARLGLMCHSYQQNTDLCSVKVLLSHNFLVVVDCRRALFALPLDHVLGFGLNDCSKDHKIEVQFKIFFHFGELLLLKEALPAAPLHAVDAQIEKNSVLFELKTDLMTRIGDLRADSPPDAPMRCRQTKEVLLRRNPLSPDSSFGFHVQSRALTCDHLCVFVTEANEHALRVNQLRSGQRLLELCHIPIVGLTYDHILDFLRTSQSVSVTLVQPLADGSPRVTACFAHSCGRQPTTKAVVDSLPKTYGNDYENVCSATTTTTPTRPQHDSPTTTAIISQSHSPYDRHHNTRQHMTTPTTSHSTQRPLHLKTTSIHHNINQNHSSQSSTTSSTLQEDLIKLITLNDSDDQNNDPTLESSNLTDSHSSSRYSTATSTPYSSLERRSDRQTTTADDCVVTVAKPAFVVDDNLNDNVVVSSSESWPQTTELSAQVRKLSKEKSRLNETIRQLKEENQRLHFESQTASQQLRKFTEWFFSSNNNN